MVPVNQDVVLMMIPYDAAWDISSKGGKMAMNRACIDEEMANESSGVFYNKEHRLRATSTQGLSQADFPGKNF